MGPLITVIAALSTERIIEITLGLFFAETLKYFVNKAWRKIDSMVKDPLDTDEETNL